MFFWPHCMGAKTGIQEASNELDYHPSPSLDQFVRYAETSLTVRHHLENTQPPKKDSKTHQKATDSRMQRTFVTTTSCFF